MAPESACPVNMTKGVFGETVGRVRDCGIYHEKFVARVAEIDAILDQARLEKFRVSNDKRHITQVAEKFLSRAGWLPSSVES